MSKFSLDALIKLWFLRKTKKGCSTCFYDALGDTEEGIAMELARYLEEKGYKQLETHYHDANPEPEL